MARPRHSSPCSSGWRGVARSCSTSSPRSAPHSESDSFTAMPTPATLCGTQASYDSAAGTRSHSDRGNSTWSTLTKVGASVAPKKNAMPSIRPTVGTSSLGQDSASCARCAICTRWPPTSIARRLGTRGRWTSYTTESAQSETAILHHLPAKVATRSSTRTAATIAHPEPLTDTVERLSRRPARKYRQWVVDQTAVSGRLPVRSVRFACLPSRRLSRHAVLPRPSADSSAHAYRRRGDRNVARESSVASATRSAATLPPR